MCEPKTFVLALVASVIAITWQEEARMPCTQRQWLFQRFVRVTLTSVKFSLWGLRTVFVSLFPHLFNLCHLSKFPSTCRGTPERSANRNLRAKSNKKLCSVNLNRCNYFLWHIHLLSTTSDMQETMSTISRVLVHPVILACGLELNSSFKKVVVWKRSVVTL